jgi:hypothetical protein
MQRLPGPANPLDRFMHLLGAGILGVISFAVISIIMLPLIIITLPYVLYIRWKVRRQMRDLSEQMQQAFGGMGGMAGMGRPPVDEEAEEGDTVEDDAPAGTQGRKHVDVTVKTVGFEDNPADDDR